MCVCNITLFMYMFCMYICVDDCKFVLLYIIVNQRELQRFIACMRLSKWSIIVAIFLIKFTFVIIYYYNLSWCH